MPKVCQEFYCGECCGYFTCKLDAALTRIVEIVCPNCGHQHQRKILNGAIVEDGRFGGGVQEQVYAPKSSFSRKPKTKWVQALHSLRNARVVTSADDIDDSQEQNAKFRLRELWFQSHGDKV